MASPVMTFKRKERSSGAPAGKAGAGALTGGEAPWARSLRAGRSPLGGPALRWTSGERKAGQELSGERPSPGSVRRAPARRGAPLHQALLAKRQYFQTLDAEARPGAKAQLPPPRAARRAQYPWVHSLSFREASLPATSRHGTPRLRARLGRTPSGAHAALAPAGHCALASLACGPIRWHLTASSHLCPRCARCSWRRRRSFRRCLSCPGCRRVSPTRVLQLALVFPYTVTALTRSLALHSRGLALPRAPAGCRTRRPGARTLLAGWGARLRRVQASGPRPDTDCAAPTRRCSRRCARGRCALRRTPPLIRKGLWKRSLWALLPSRRPPSPSRFACMCRFAFQRSRRVMPSWQPLRPHLPNLSSSRPQSPFSTHQLQQCRSRAQLTRRWCS